MQDSVSNSGASLANDSRLEGVLEIAKEAHFGQLRKDKRTPYIKHPQLASDILDYFGREDFLQAMGIEPGGKLNEEQRASFQPLLSAVGLGDSTVIDEEAYQRIKQFLKALLLLHDVVEENPKYRDNPQLLQDKLNRLAQTSRASHAPGATVSRQWTEHLFDCVMEMTDGAYRYDGNLTWQLDALPAHKSFDKRPRQVAHVRTTHPECRLAKILDQTATVLENLTHTDLSAFMTPRRENRQALKAAREKLSTDKAFMHKATDVSRACRGENRGHPYHDFFKRVADYFEKNCDLAQDGKFAEYEARRDKFSIGHAVIATRNASAFPERRKQVSTPEALSFVSPVYGHIETGLKRITVAADSGKVLSYSVIVSPKSGNSAANEIAHKLCTGLESMRSLHVNTQMTEEQKLKPKGMEEQPGALPARDYTLDPPYDLIKFLMAAQQAKAIDRSFMEKLKEYRRLSRSQNFQEEAGARR